MTDGAETDRGGDARLTAADLPAPEVATDALVGPLLAGSSKHRHVFAADTGAVRLQHLRLDARKGLHDVNEVRPAGAEERAAAPLVGGPALYAGVFTDHFGHMLAEGMHRLWAAALPALAGRLVVFQLREGRTTEVPAWLAQLLALYGIHPRQIVFVNRPIRFAELHVPRQGRVLGGAMPIAAYPGLFPLQPIAPDPHAPAGLYVSRRQHLHSGSYLGETLVEQLLGRAGFEILYPETVPLAATLRKLVSARRIVFCEGSAIHNLELTGRVDAQVLVIGRREGTAERFGRVLDATTAGWSVFGQGRGTVCLDWDKARDRPMASRSCSFTDLPALIDTLAAFAGTPLPVPAAAALRREEAADLLRYLVDPRTGTNATDEQLGRMLRMLRQAEDVRALLPAPRRSRSALHRPRA